MRSAEIRYVYDEAFARTATKRFLSRYARGLLLGLLIVAIAGIGFLMIRAFAAGVISMIIAAVIAVALRGYSQRAVALARSLGQPEIHVIVDDGGLSFSMNGNRSRSEWSRHRIVWRFDDVWLFFPYGVSSSYTGIPAAAMTSEFRDIVVDNLKTHGGTLR